MFVMMVRINQMYYTIEPVSIYQAHNRRPQLGSLQQQYSLESYQLLKYGCYNHHHYHLQDQHHHLVKSFHRIIVSHTILHHHHHHHNHRHLEKGKSRESAGAPINPSRLHLSHSTSQTLQVKLYFRIAKV